MFFNLLHASPTAAKPSSQTVRTPLNPCGGLARSACETSATCNGTCCQLEALELPAHFRLPNFEKALKHSFWDKQCCYIRYSVVEGSDGLSEAVTWKRIPSIKGLSLAENHVTDDKRSLGSQVSLPV